ncbi:MAG: sigma-E factor negative regulatory protein [Cocleimonas sp.]
MNKSNKTISMTEHLSALLDDETGEFEQRRVLDELKSDKKLCNKFSSYALIGETMRSASVEKNACSAGTSFLAGIHEKIDAEDEYNQVTVGSNNVESYNDAQSQKSWLRPVGGFALAASIAAIAVLGVQNYQLTKKSDLLTASLSAQSQKSLIANTIHVAAPVVANVDVDTALPIDDVTDNSEQYRQADSHVKSLLKSYVDSHMQYATHTTFVPSVRVIAYADNK